MITYVIDIKLKFKEVPLAKAGVWPVLKNSAIGALKTGGVANEFLNCTICDLTDSLELK